VNVNAAQPPPIANDTTPIVDLVLGDLEEIGIAHGRADTALLKADLRARAEAGKVKYGVYLQAHNGRDALVDAYQEATDLVMYLAQKIRETATYDADLEQDYAAAIQIACRLAGRVQR
jgi:hypothetical protein